MRRFVEGVGAKQKATTPHVAMPPVVPRWIVPRGGVVFGILLLAVCLFVPHRDAQADGPCPIPDGLALKEISLPAARHAVMADHRLAVLILGGAHIAAAATAHRDTSYPGQLEAQLRAALPEIDVTVDTEAFPASTAADIPPMLPAMIERTGARLVIWGPGGGNISPRLDPREFIGAVDAGIAATRQGGADLILLDMSFLPAPARMALIEPFRERLRQAALAEHVPFLPRHALMRRWYDDKTLNLLASDPAEQEIVSHRLYACMAQSLAAPIAAAVR